MIPYSLLGQSTKVHLYWAMKNCSSEDLQLDTSKPYQVRTIPAQYSDHQLMITKIGGGVDTVHILLLAT